MATTLTENNWGLSAFPQTPPSDTFTYKDIFNILNAIRQMTAVLQAFIDGSISDLDGDLQQLISQAVLTLNGSIQQLDNDIHLDMAQLESDMQGYVTAQLAPILSALSNKIDEAPEDGTRYLRKDGAWDPE